MFLYYNYNKIIGSVLLNLEGRHSLSFTHNAPLFSQNKNAAIKHSPVCICIRINFSFAFVAS